MELRLRASSLIVVFAFALASPARALVIAYTDRAAWEAAVLAVESGHFHYPVLGDLRGPGPLSTGANPIEPWMVIVIPGTPGSNAIDDSPTAPLSPNGATYYLGDVGIGASEAPRLAFMDYGAMFQVIGFGADWVIDGDLFFEVQETSFSFGSLLPTGVGFLGIVSDRMEPEMVVSLSGAALFGMGEIWTANVPEPGWTSLLCSALVGLFAIRRRP